jgi:hypothetical protein
MVLTILSGILALAVGAIISWFIAKSTFAAKLSSCCTLLETEKALHLETKTQKEKELGQVNNNIQQLILERDNLKTSNATFRAEISATNKQSTPLDIPGHPIELAYPLSSYRKCLYCFDLKHFVFPTFPLSLHLIQSKGSLARTVVLMIIKPIIMNFKLPAPVVL